MSLHFILFFIFNIYNCFHVKWVALQFFVKTAPDSIPLNVRQGVISICEINDIDNRKTRRIFDQIHKQIILCDER